MIAIVDDDALVRAVITGVLEGVGFQVEAFPDARTALARLSGVTPRLVLSDVAMPGMDGLEFRRAYAERFGDRRTPFLFFSALDGDADQVLAALTGADDHLTKPASASALVARVRECLRRAEAFAPGGRPVAERR